MKCLKLVACLFLTGCTSTEIIENGHRVFKTQADMTGFTFQSAATYVHADTLIHSLPTLAGGSAVQGDISAVASAAAVIGSAVVANGAVMRAPLAAAIAPAASGAVAHIANAVTNPPSKTAAIANAAARPAVAYHGGVTPATHRHHKRRQHQ